MKSDTQADHLNKLMQKHTAFLTYELALPLVTVRSSKLEKLSVGDVFLLGFDMFECILMDGDTVYAHLVLKHIKNRFMLEIIDLAEEKYLLNDSKKHQNIKFSLGQVHIKALEAGQVIDVAQVDTDSIHLVLEHKNMAKCSLVSVDNEIAVKIDKVLK